MRHDLVILGSGSTAFAAALRARDLGKTAVMTEERVTGGTCVNRGCLPSKNLIEAVKIVHDARHPRYPGLAPAEIAVDFAALIAQKDALVDEYRAEKYEALIGSGIALETGHAHFVDPHTVEVGGKRLLGDAFLIATGARPVIPAIEGLDRVPFLTSDLLSSGEADELRALPRSLLVIGAGYIALELGQMFARLGVEVTMLERGPEILAHGYEPETGPAVRQLLGAEGVRILTNARVHRVEQQGDRTIAIVDVAGASTELHAEKLLVATGRRPNTDHLAIDRAGVVADGRGAIVVDAHLRTNVPHIFAAGDVIGGSKGSQMATPVGSRDGGIAAMNALVTTGRAVDYRVVPRVIFVDPPVATVGRTERDAIADGHRCWCRAVPLSLVPRAGATRDTEGFVKMVADADSHEVLGVTMVGAGAHEVIHEAAMGLRFRARLDDFIDLVHVYPTMSEALKLAAISRFKDPAKLSCCAT